MTGLGVAINCLLLDRKHQYTGTAWSVCVHETSGCNVIAFEGQGSFLAAERDAASAPHTRSGSSRRVFCYEWLCYKGMLRFDRSDGF